MTQKRSHNVWEKLNVHPARRCGGAAPQHLSYSMKLLRDPYRPWSVRVSGCPGCPGVHVSGCPGVHVSRCPGVLVSRCPGVRVFRQVSWSSGVQVSGCSGVGMSRCPCVQVSRCPDVLVSGCPGVLVSGCPGCPGVRLGVKISRCPGVQVSRISRTSLLSIPPDPPRPPPRGIPQRLRSLYDTTQHRGECDPKCTLLIRLVNRFSFVKFQVLIAHPRTCQL